MKTLRKTIFILAVLFSFSMNGQTISHIEQSGSWYRIYDQNGKSTRSLSTSNGELVGYSSSMFILRSGSWYYIYSPDGKRERSMSVSTVGEILNVAGDTFTSRSGSWIYTWNRDGKKVNTRSAH